MLSLGDIITYFKADTSDLDKSFDESEEKSKGWVGRVGGTISEGLKGAAFAGAKAVSGIIVDLGKAALDLGSQFKQVNNDLAAQFGLTDTAAGELTNTVKDIFGGNFGNDIDDVKQALIDTRTNMMNLNSVDLRGATEQAIMIRDVFGIEIPESTNTANTLMENFGLTSEQAFNFIVAGQQRGLNASGDFADSIGEYAPQFAAAGFTADQFFSTMETGAQGGVLGTDKITDAIKEMRLRLNGGADDAKAAFTAMGLDYDKIAGRVSSGNASWAEYFSAIQDGLKGIHDPIQREAAGVAIFGTQWEDAGSSAILGIDMAKTGMADLDGSVSGLAVKYDNLGSLFGGVWRSFQVGVLTPIGEKMLEFGNKILPYVSEALGALGTVFNGEGGLGGIVERLGGLFDSVAPQLLTGVQSLLTMLAEQVVTNLPNWIQTMAQMGEWFVKWLIDSGPQLLEAFGTAWAGLVAFVVEKAPEWAGLLMDLGTKLGAWIVEALPGIMTNLGLLWEQLTLWVATNAPLWGQELMKLGAQIGQWILDALPILGTNLGLALGALIQWVTDSLPTWGQELWKLAEKLVGWVVDSLPTLGENLGKALSALLGWIVQTAIDVGPDLLALAGKFFGWIVTDVIPALPGELAKILKALGDFIDSTIKALAPTLTNLAIKFYTWITDEVLPQIPIKLGEIWTAIDTWITQTAKDALAAASAIGANIADGIGGAIELGLAGLHDLVADIVNPIITGINATIDGLNLVNPFDDIPHLSYMASGGITQGGLVVLGEGPGGIMGLERVQGPGGLDVLAGAGLYNVSPGLRVTPAQQTADELFAGRGSVRQVGRDIQPIHNTVEARITIDLTGAKSDGELNEMVKRASREGANELIQQYINLADLQTAG